MQKMANILIIYSTTDGHTLEICLRLKQIIEKQNNQVTLVSVDEVNSAELNKFDKIIIGASIRYGKHSKQIYQFIKQNEAMLDSKSNAFFSVNVVARKPEKRQADTNPYVKKFLRQISWQPKNVAVFAGKIDYKKYSLFDRTMIRMIMWITKGPTDPDTNIDFTDWAQVEAFGRLICDM
jgi:menaquinone-dependent protoporphyrinogen oxidase